MQQKNPKNLKTKTAKLFIIDGHALCYRAYYAIRNLSNSKGEPTNAIYGFVTMLNKIIQAEQPEYFAVCFDRKEPTFRHKKYDFYKAHRKPMPEDLIPQIEAIKEFCRAYRFEMFEKAGFEADDVIGTLAVQAEKRNLDVFIVTSDKDAMQLINEKIKVFSPHQDGKIIDADEVRKKFDGLGPEKVVEILALMGDASDNIPGVRGIGEKSALKLIKQFESVENLIKNVSEVGSKSQRELIKEHEKDLVISKELVQLDLNVPLDIDWEQIKWKAPDEEKLVALLKRYEFRALLKGQTSSQPSAPEDRHYASVTTVKALENLTSELKKVSAFSLDTETTSPHPVEAELVGISVCFEAMKAFYIPVSSDKHTGPGLPIKEVLSILKPVLESSTPEKYGQNMKYDWIVFKRHGVTVQGVSFDTMLASYLVNPIKMNHNLDDISFEYLGIQKIPTTALIGSGAKQILMSEVPIEKITEYACEDADAVYRLTPILQQKLKENELEKLFQDVELPLAEVLAKMEMNGVAIDSPFLKDLSDECEKELKALTRAIYQEAGEEFNINSTKQLAEILFVKLNLPTVRKTKTGHSTDVNVLEKLAETHELPKKLLEYREKSKLKSTYLDALQEIVSPRTGLIHTSYHQTTTATGRLSSSDPNLQNIPIKTEAGRMIRKAFVPRPDKAKRVILSADYSQIELRILAHLSGDKNLVKAFKEDRDIHKFTATLLYDVDEAGVTREMRDAAKVTNFSIIYGKTAYGLSKDLGLAIPEASAFIQNYFNRYKAVKDYLDGQLEEARKQGYLTTILGRRAYFPEINSKNMQMRQFAERAATNAPIQGSAADLIKLAMIQVQKRLEKEGMASLMIMQVHDELVFDAPEKELSKLESLVREHMENAFSLRVPLKVDLRSGSSWYKK